MGGLGSLLVASGVSVLLRPTREDRDSGEGESAKSLTSSAKLRRDNLSSFGVFRTFSMS